MDVQVKGMDVKCRNQSNNFPGRHPCMPIAGNKTIKNTIFRDRHPQFNYMKKYKCIWMSSAETGAIISPVGIHIWKPVAGN